MHSRSCVRHKKTVALSVSVTVSGSGMFFRSHLNCCFSLSMCLWGGGGDGGGGSQSLHYKENTLLCCWAWDSVRDFLLETVVLDDPNEIWKHCVYVCVQAVRRRSALIPASFFDGYVSCLLSSCVGCHGDDEWLPSAFLAGGGMWQS